VQRRRGSRARARAFLHAHPCKVQSGRRAWVTCGGEAIGDTRLVASLHLHLHYSCFTPALLLNYTFFLQGGLGGWGGGGNKRFAAGTDSAVCNRRSDLLLGCTRISHLYAVAQQDRVAAAGDLRSACFTPTLHLPCTIFTRRSRNASRLLAIGPEIEAQGRRLAALRQQVRTSFTPDLLLVYARFSRQPTAPFPCGYAPSRQS
jgi:hypothetical protein